MAPLAIDVTCRHPSEAELGTGQHSDGVAAYSGRCVTSTGQSIDSVVAQDVSLRRVIASRFQGCQPWSTVCLTVFHGEHEGAAQQAGRLRQSRRFPASHAASAHKPMAEGDAYQQDAGGEGVTLPLMRYNGHPGAKMTKPGTDGADLSYAASSSPNTGHQRPVL